MLRNKIKQIIKKKKYISLEKRKKKSPEERCLEKGEDHLQFNRKKTPTDLTHVAQSTPPPLPPLPTLLGKHRRSFKSQVTVVPSSKLAGASSVSSRVQYATTVRFCVCFCSQRTLKLRQTLVRWIPLFLWYDNMPRAFLITNKRYNSSVDYEDNQLSRGEWL